MYVSIEGKITRLEPRELEEHKNNRSNKSMCKKKNINLDNWMCFLSFKKVKLPTEVKTADERESKHIHTLFEFGVVRQ
jgi:hypothetical protein